MAAILSWLFSGSQLEHIHKEVFIWIVPRQGMTTYVTGDHLEEFETLRKTLEKYTQGHGGVMW